MEGTRFDSMVRALGEGRSRRGFVGLLAGLAAGGLAADAGAKRRCRRDSPAGQCCKKRNGVVACTCDNGGTVCGADCCLIGQVCQGGACVQEPEPTTCIAYGEACKGVGRACCEGFVCGSGQGGQDDVACYVRKTGRCAETAECVYGTECVSGICTGLPVCDRQLGETCTPADICCTGSCSVVQVDGRGALATRCCAAIGGACSDDQECCISVQIKGRAPRNGSVGCVDNVCAQLFG